MHVADTQVSCRTTYVHQSTISLSQLLPPSSCPFQYGKHMVSKDGRERLSMQLYMFLPCLITDLRHIITRHVQMHKLVRKPVFENPLSRYIAHGGLRIQFHKIARTTLLVILWHKKHNCRLNDIGSPNRSGRISHYYVIYTVYSLTSDSRCRLAGWRLWYTQTARR